MAKGSGINQPLELSEEMAEFIGKDTSTRAQITKKIWDHIKKHDLQDPDDRRTIIPDETLEPILGSKPVHMLKLAGIISKHVFKD
jgi:chromatin remodeling complex protein RSC6